jgi:redox-sensitive bicupin YhaK (pirin superfamily)
MPLIRNSRPVIEGAGVRLKRAFPLGDELLFDPFLLLDDFGSDNPSDYIAGFPWHPHRGIETVTYILHGAVEHGDSIGNKGVIGDGDVQWMTAGSGIIHQEMPVRTPGRTRGFQLWVNLPSAGKMMEPRYRDVRAGTIPLVNPSSGVSIRIISGKVGTDSGPVRDIVVDIDYMDVSLAPGASWKRNLGPGRNSLVYTVSGKLDIAGFAAGVGPEHLVHLGDAASLEASGGAEGGRFLLASGIPLKEPVAWGGPIVMNTREELDLAFEQLKKGTFISHPLPKGAKPRFNRD